MTESEKRSVGIPTGYVDVMSGIAAPPLLGHQLTVTQLGRPGVDATIDADGQPTADYWKSLSRHASRQTEALESMRKMMVFFTVLAAVGLLLGLIFGIVGLVEISNSANPYSIP